MRILVIEDEMQMARLIDTVLTRHGHTTEMHSDGATGLEAALRDHVIGFSLD
jgi:DNA-binding response OmpR family regulator